MTVQILTCGNSECGTKNRVDMDRISTAFCGKCSYPMTMAAEVFNPAPATDSGWTGYPDADQQDEVGEEVLDDAPDDPEFEEDDSEEEGKILCIGCQQNYVDEAFTLCPNCEALKQAKAARKKASKKGS